MYTKQTNPAGIRSQTMISEAFLKLMQQYPMEQITITQICEKATVCRRTFYRNFEQKEDIIDFQLDKLFEIYEQELSEVNDTEFLRSHFEFMRKHLNYLILLSNHGFFDRLNTKFSNIKTKRLTNESEVEYQYRTACLNAEIQSILCIWIQRGFSESVNDVLAIRKKIQIYALEDI